VMGVQRGEQVGDGAFAAAQHGEREATQVDGAAETGGEVREGGAGVQVVGHVAVVEGEGEAGEGAESVAAQRDQGGLLGEELKGQAVVRQAAQSDARERGEDRGEAAGGGHARQQPRRGDLPDLAEEVSVLVGEGAGHERYVDASQVGQGVEDGG